MACRLDCQPRLSQLAQPGQNARPYMRMTDTFAPDSVHALYCEHHGWLYHWLRRKTGCSEQAADLAQDTFVRLLAVRRGSFGAEPRAFLTHIARNLMIDHWRRQALERAYLEALAHLPEPEAPSPETRLLVLEALCSIDAMLCRLPVTTREIFLLAQLDGLRYAQIAEQLGLSLVTVKRHMRKGFIACLEAL